MKIKNIFIVSFVVSVLFASCVNDLDELHTSPNNPLLENAGSTAIFSSSVRKVFHEDRYEFWRGPVLHADQFGDQLAHGFSHQTWWDETNSWSYSDVWTSVVWEEYWTSSDQNHNGGHILANVIYLLDKFADDESGEAKAIKGMAKVMRSYQFLKLTDAFGDIPYSQAANPTEFPSPAYESQKDVYTGILTELKEAITLLESGKTPSGYDKADMFYQGDVTNWIKFANSLRLRMAMRASNKLENANELIAEILQKPLIEDNSENGYIEAIGNSSDPLDHGYFGFFGPYPNNGPMSGTETMINMLKGESLEAANVSETVNGETNPFLGISDPRLFDMFEPTDGGEYIGRPVRKRYEDDASLVKTKLTCKLASAGSTEVIGNVSMLGKKVWDIKYGYYILTYSEVCFLRAEAALRSMGGSDAEKWYREGITASMEQWGVSGADITAYFAQPNTTLAANPADDLEQVYTQRWIASLTVPFQAWSIMRRTGYPTYATLAKDKKVPSNTDLFQYHQGDVGVNIPGKMAVPLKEGLLNSKNVPEGANKMTTKVWWAK